MPGPAIFCPSWQCEKGATLLGIVLADGSVAFAKNRIIIDENFVEAARQGRSPEKRFRFSGTCRQAGCIQWKGDRCGVIDRVMEEQTPRKASATIRECLIRPNCRWHLQAGDSACLACPDVITDLHEEIVA
jgi:hypothetical protein